MDFSVLIDNLDGITSVAATIMALAVLFAPIDALRWATKKVLSFIRG